MSDENALNRALGRIEGKQDLILSHINRLSDDQAVLRGDFEKLGDRVTKVERRLVWWAGAAAAASTVVYFFKDKVTGLFA